LTLELRLVAAGPGRGLARGREETQPVEQRLGRLEVFAPDTSLHFSHVDAAGPERMTVGQEVEEQRRCDFVAAQVSNKDGRVEQMDAQRPDSARRVLRTHAAAASRSRQCGYSVPRAIPADERMASASARRSSFSAAASSRNRLRPRFPTTLSIASSISSDMITCVRATTAFDKSHW